jgi:hypothetical protein
MDGVKMEGLEQLAARVNENWDDLEAWKSILVLVDDDPKKKKDCQEQIDRIMAKQQAPLICSQCGAGMTVYFAGELHDKRAKCPYCGTEIDIPDAFSRAVVEKRAGFGQILPETDVTIYERRADNNGAMVTSAEIEKLIMEKGLIVARQELEARGIQGVNIGGFAGTNGFGEANRILEEQGAKALAKSQGAILVTSKQANSMFKGMLIFFIVLSFIGISSLLIQIFLIR